MDMGPPPATVYFRVVNFDRFQHYSDRSPPWIKLYNSLLDDYSFSSLQDASKFHLVAIWLLASRSNNKIPWDPDWIGKQINATEHVNLEELEAHDFIKKIKHSHKGSNSLAGGLQDARPEKSREEKSREEKNTSPVPYTSTVAITLPLNNGHNYLVLQDHVSEWEKLYPAVNVEQELRNMKGWCAANPTKRKTIRGVNKFINGWLSRAQDKGPKQLTVAEHRKKTKMERAMQAVGDKFGDAN